jgi:hypothetical protein
MMVILESLDVNASRMAASSGGNDIFATVNLPFAIRLGRTMMKFDR